MGLAREAVEGDAKPPAKVFSCINSRPITEIVRGMSGLSNNLRRQAFQNCSRGQSHNATLASRNFDPNCVPFRLSLLSWFAPSASKE